MKKIFVSGGSHCIGGGFNWDEVIKVYENKGHVIKNRHDITYPQLVANYFNVEVIFEGAFGGSINRMIRKTYEYILENDVKDVLFILELPPGWRDEFYSNELNRMVNITIGNVLSPDDNTEVANGYDMNDLHKIHKNISDYFYSFIDYNIDRKKWMMNLLGLLSYFKLNNLKYIVIDTGDFQNFLRTNSKSENEFSLLWFNNGNAMHNWINDEKLTIKCETEGLSGDEHLGLYGHRLVADKIINYIENDYK